jgi:hypothetical protein
MPRFLLFLSIVAILFSGVLVEPVSAQSCSTEVDADWQNQTTEDYQFVAGSGSLGSYGFPNAGWDSSWTVSVNRELAGWKSPDVPESLVISRTFTNYTLCSLIAYSFNSTFHLNTRRFGAYVKLDGESSWTELAYVNMPVGTNSYQAPIVNWSGSLVIDELALVGAAGGGTFTAYHALLNDDPPNPIIKRPIYVDDEHSLAVWDENDYLPPDPDTADPVANINFQTAIDLEAEIYSIEDGEVIEIEQINEEVCTVYTGLGATPLFQGEHCAMAIPDSLQNDDMVNNYSINYEPNLIGVTAHEIYRVRVSSTQGTATYLLREPRAEVGMNIKEGCRLGTALTLNPERNQAIPGNPLGLVVFGYSTSVNDLTDIFQDVDVVDYVTPGDDCNVDPDYKDCLTINPFFADDGKYWEATSQIYKPIWNNPGVTLGKGAGIMLPGLQLESATEYGASLSAATNSWSGGNLTVQVGTTTHTVALTDTTSTYTIPSQTYAADDGLLYTVKLINNSNTSINVDYFCLTDGTPQMTECVFLNADFRNGLQYWSTGGAEISGFEQPILKVTDGDSLSQSVTIGSGTYDLEITYTIPTPYISTSYSISYTFDNDPTEYISDLITLDSSTPATKIATDEFILTEEHDAGDFQFNVVGATPTSFFYIKKICLNLSDGDDGGGGGEDLTDPSCLYNPAMPDAAPVDIALQWHWGNMSRLYNCKVIPILKSIDKTLKDTFAFLGKQFQWGMHLAFKTVQWVGNDLLPWLAGYLSNIQPGNIVVNTNGGSNTCQAFDVFCWIAPVLESLVDQIGTTFTTAITTFGDVLTTGMNTLASIVRDSIGPLSNIFVTMIDRLADVIISVNDQITDIILTLIDRMTDVINHIVYTIGNVLNTLFYNLSDLFQVLISELGNILRALFDTLLELLKLIADTVIRPLMDIVVYLIRQIIDTLLVPLFRIVIQFIDFLLNFVLYLMVALARLGFSLVIRLFEIAGYGLNILTTILQAWTNAPPKTVEGFPDCDLSPNEGLCEIWWVMENTVLSGPGELIVPIFAAICWILLGIYLARELRGAVLKTAGNFI